LRCFFALWPDSSVRARLAHRADSVHLALGGRVMRPESLHVTLVFLGKLNEERRASAERLADSLRFHPFELAIDTWLLAA